MADELISGDWEAFDVAENAVGFALDGIDFGWLGMVACSIFSEEGSEFFSQETKYKGLSIWTLSHILEDIFGSILYICARNAEAG
jgi:hypothetical protein